MAEKVEGRPELKVRAVVCACVVAAIIGGAYRSS
jgi:hypothetical protein